jgi:hypothetical protein
VVAPRVLVPKEFAVSRRLVPLALLVAAGLGGGAPAHAARVCQSHNLAPQANAAGFVCVDTADPDLIACGGNIGTLQYICV